MEFQKIVTDQDLMSWIVSGTTIDKALEIISDNLINQYNVSQSNLLGLAIPDGDLAEGIATSYGGVKLADLQNAINNSDSTILAYQKNGSTKEVEVENILQDMRESKCNAAAVLAGIETLKESIQNESKGTVNELKVHYETLSGTTDTTQSTNFSMIGSIVSNARLSIQDKLHSLLNLFAPDETPTDFDDYGTSGIYEIGSCWQCFTTLITGWNWTRPFEVVQNFFAMQIYAGFKMSYYAFLGIYNLFLGFGNWMAMKIGGKKYTRINNYNSLPDTGGFKFTLYTTGTEIGWVHEWESDGFMTTINNLFNTSKAISFIVPGGSLILYGWNPRPTTGTYGEFEFNFRFIPENQANLVPSDDNHVEGINPYLTLKYSDDWTDGEGSLFSTGVDDFGQIMTKAVNSMCIDDPYNKLEPAWLNMDNATDYTQWCSSYRSSFVLFIKGMCDLDPQFDGDGNPTTMYTHYGDWSSDYCWHRLISLVNLSYVDDLTDPFGLDGNLGHLTCGRTTGAVVSNYRSGSDGQFANGINTMLKYWFMSYRNYLRLGINYNWPVYQIIDSFPQCGVHVSTSDEFQKEFKQFFRNAAIIAGVVIATVGVIIVRKKLGMAALAAQASADRYYFSDEYDGSKESITHYYKLVKKANRLNFLAGTGVAAAGGLTSSSSSSDFSPIIDLISGHE